ncbi:MAG: gamma-glutamylcyclotransferase [Bacteroidetes bacterium]|nr:gamma-glutamylcyclotransferase [Bacteroidota bacterium]
MSDNISNLFVYGTLRDDSINHMAHYLKANGVYKGQAFIYAKLYKITWYPAIVLDSSKSFKVYGDVYELPLASREKVLHELDGYEGIYHSNEESDEYERVETIAHLSDEQTLDCWVYNYKAVVDETNWIKSGDFILDLKQK